MTDLHAKIEQYLDDELPAAERQAFDEALAADENLQRDLARQRDLAARLRAARLRKKVKNSVVLDTARSGEGWTYSVNYGRTLAAAAALILLVAAVLFFLPGKHQSTEIATPTPPKTETTQPRPEQAPKQEIAETPKPRNLETSKPETPNPKPENLQIYAAALAELETVELRTMGAEKSDKQIEAQLKTADQLLRDKKPTEAQLVLDAVFQKNNPLYRDEIEWRQTLCLLLLDPPAARTALQKIARTDTHGFQENARNLLAAIKK